MAITLSWKNEDESILYLHYMYPWTWEEFYQTRDTAFEWLDCDTSPVKLILDFTGSEQLPLGAMIHFYNVGKEPHPRVDEVAIVVSSTFLRMYANMYVRLNIKKASMATVYATVEEAIEQFTSTD